MRERTAPGLVLSGSVLLTPDSWDLETWRLRGVPRSHRLTCQGIIAGAQVVHLPGVLGREVAALIRIIGEVEQLDRLPSTRLAPGSRAVLDFLIGRLPLSREHEFPVPHADRPTPGSGIQEDLLVGRRLTLGDGGPG